MSASFGGDFLHEPVLEGFLCPICKADLKTPDLLTAHVDAEHTEQDQDLIRSFRGMLQSAKNKIRNEFSVGPSFSERDAKATASSPASSSPSSSAGGGGGAANLAGHTSAYPPLFADPPQAQLIGADMVHTAYFKAIRTPRLERYATETNKLIIRLHKLLSHRPADRAERKQHEQYLVPWLDGKLVKLCPSCAKRFLLTRRQHHCRLCGSIMCSDCSRFVDIDVAAQLVNPMAAAPQSETAAAAVGGPSDVASSAARAEDNTLRVCDHCLHLLGTRQDMQDSRTFRPHICALYERIERLKTDVRPDCAAYEKVVASLLTGDTIFTLADAGALRGRIGQAAESMDTLSKAIVVQPALKGTQTERLQRFVRLACVQYIKEQMLELAALPTEAEVEARQRRRRQVTEQRIERERRLALEQWERRAAVQAAFGGNGGEDETRGGAVRRADNDGRPAQVTTLDAWSGQQATAVGQVDVLVEQIHNIKGYIKQARDALRFEEVETLELHLRELQQEFYERQQAQD